MEFSPIFKRFYGVFKRCLSVLMTFLKKFFKKF